MARELLNGSFNAGSSYADVWIRDTATFVELACEVNAKADVKDALLQFLRWQKLDGEIPGGYVINRTANHTVAHFPPCRGPGTPVCKNTVETDQETSLVLAFARYIEACGDQKSSVLREEIDGVTVLSRLEQALLWVRANRWEALGPQLDGTGGLVLGGTTMDWGDVQPEEGLPDERMLSAGSHEALDLYDNAMFVLAVRALLKMQSDVTDSKAARADWASILRTTVAWIRALLWNDAAGQYRPHVYLGRGSPFPAGFDEQAIFCSGSTWVAAEAKLLSDEELSRVLRRMGAIVSEVKGAGGDVTYGLTVYPPYPQNLTTHMMRPWTYQNGGDWAWFGGRLVSALVQYGRVDEGERVLQPMVDRVVAHGGFFEWWDRQGRPQGSARFHGAAGVLGKAIQDVAKARAHALPPQELWI